ncbi:hypothetical protein PTKIN_Ptkin05aG0101500 [Pterospermum kingtungense]
MTLGGERWLRSENASGNEELMDTELTPPVTEVKESVDMETKLAVDSSGRLKSALVMHVNPAFTSAVDVSLINAGQSRNVGQSSNSNDAGLVLGGSDDRKKRRFSEVHKAQTSDMVVDRPIGDHEKNCDVGVIVPFLMAGSGSQARRDP